MMLSLEELQHSAPIPTICLLSAPFLFGNICSDPQIKDRGLSRLAGDIPFSLNRTQSIYFYVVLMNGQSNTFRHQTYGRIIRGCQTELHNHLE